jgi:hypothetical protein
MLYIYPISLEGRQYARNLTPLENHYPEISRSFRLGDSTITKFFAIALFFLQQKYLNIVLLILKIFFF